jgi:ferredoxin
MIHIVRTAVPSVEIPLPGSTDGETLQSLALEYGVSIGGACGGLGLCTTCKVSIQAGGDKLPRLTRAEKDFLAQGLLQDGERLACQFCPTESVTVFISS